ncbi:hypothetical protein [Pseudomonas sp. EYE_354]|uniref:hypothetical protein n=1 Tax=Pseudomonas sp. EYE_354 TaxID=2853449 RepID=UPI0020054B15|nr:hypothetical protein [Pseudomonas sp. EYE_354]MCK6191190.1 hypothetical protein [Pseudomonas sp. EYE_354]
MTSIDTWPPWIAIIFISAPGLLAIAGTGYSLYLSRYHLNAIREALKNSRYIYLWGPSLGRRGLIWSLLEIAKIAGMVLWSKAYIQMGDVNPADLEHFPPYLKRHLIVDTALMLASLAWLTVVVILLELR